MADTSLIPPVRTLQGTLRVVTRRELAACASWAEAFSAHRKDRRYYEIVEETILQGFDYRYFMLEDQAGTAGAIQPFFVHDQDLLEGGSSAGFVGRVVNKIRKVFPRFLKMRTLMVGCAAGEGHLDQRSDEQAIWAAACLHAGLKRMARQLRAPMVVLKEFPACYRQSLKQFATDGYTRVPSMPMVRLGIAYASFDDYMTTALSKNTRKNLRRKFRDVEELTADAPITHEVLTDITPVVDEVYPLYLQVYEKSKMHFEKLTKEFLCRLGREMTDKVRFFVWRQKGKAIGFSLIMLDGDTLYDEYVGLDYSVALDLSLYHVTLRDVIEWGMKNGMKWYCSTSLGYEPKLHLKCDLVPLDLYVAHTSPLANVVLKRVLPLLEPTRSDPTLKKFPNYAELWGRE